MKLYERQKSEAKQSYDAFTKYLQMGDSRNLPALAKNLNIPIKSLRGKAKKWDWDIRIKEYETDNGKGKTDSNQKIVANQKDLIIAEIENLSESVLESYELINKKLLEDENRFDKLSFDSMFKNFGDMMNLIRESLKILKEDSAKTENKMANLGKNINEKINNNKEIFNLAEELLTMIADY